MCIRDRFMFFLPEFNAFCQAEEINHTLHNLYTPRGAQVRDGRKWSQYIDQVITKFGPRTEVSFGSHHWPVWGNTEILSFWAASEICIATYMIKHYGLRIMATPCMKYLSC